MTHYLTSSQRRVDALLVYVHKASNAFATAADAHRAAREVLHLDTYAVWSKRAGRSPKLVAEVSL